MVKNIDNGEVVGAIVDLRKAFDVVDNELLIVKLSIYKFSQSFLNWVKSYLTNRKQCIIERNFSYYLEIIISIIIIIIIIYLQGTQIFEYIYNS